MKLSDLVVRVMLEENKSLSGNEIWSIILKRGYNSELDKVGKTPWATIDSYLGECSKGRSAKGYTVKIESGHKPRKFYLIKTDVDKSHNEYNINKSNNIQKESKEILKKFDYKEIDLHPVLSSYMYYNENNNILTKTINHSKSLRKSKGENEWLHPDMVGVYSPLNKWNDSIVEFSENTSSIPLTIYSFELKRGLDFTNIRESYFQAVSNSSWANEGYLVAEDISDDTKFLNELKRLSDSFGIGIIKLDKNNPLKSKVLFNAKYKKDIDLETISKLSEENSDFKGFIKAITRGLKAKKFYSEEFDSF